MGKIISVISQKGGVGKSTVTTLLANIFTFKYNLKVCVLDFDYPQSSIVKRRLQEEKIRDNNPRFAQLCEKVYKDGRGPYKVLSVKISDAGAALDEFRDAYDVIFVDAPGTINATGYLEFLSEINYLLLPCLQDNFSMMSTFEFYEKIVKPIAMESSAYEGALFFFNRVPAQNKVKFLLPAVETMGIKISEIHLRAYTDYERTFRSTLFPIPEKEHVKASVHLHKFADYIFSKVFENGPKTAAYAG